MNRHSLITKRRLERPSESQRGESSLLAVGTRAAPPALTNKETTTMSFRLIVKLAAFFVVALTATAASAQMPNPYGQSINAESAKKVAAAALAEARKNGWTQAAAIVDTAGELVYFEKLDGTQFASNDIAIDKAKASVRFKRPTKVLQDALAAGGEGWRFLTLRGVVAAEGGVPLLMDGKIVGAIGVSGGTGAQDGQAANAGVAALK